MNDDGRKYLSVKDDEEGEEESSTNCQRCLSQVSPNKNLGGARMVIYMKPFFYRKLNSYHLPSY